VLKVSNELNYIKYDEIITNKLHLKRIMGLYICPTKGFSYSCGEDKKFKVYDFTKNETIADLTLGTADLTGLTVDKDN